MIEAALQWASDGVPVFPVAGKVPKTEHGLKDATLDEAQICSWWSAWPDAGIGGAVGDAAGCWVLDLDGEEGLASLAELEEEHGPLPETRRVRTGGGGLHLWFAMPEGRQIKNRARVMPGVDVRGTGGYVVLPPSLHPSGQRYKLEGEHDIALAPGWLLDLVAPVKRAAPPPPPPRQGPQVGSERRRVLGMVGAAADRIRSAPVGTRNATANRECYSIGGYLDAAGLTVEEVAPLLEAATVAAEQPAALVRRALEDGRAAARGLPPDEREARDDRGWRAKTEGPLPPEPPDEEEPQIDYARTPDGRPYLVVPPGASGAWFVAVPDGGYRFARESLVRAQLQIHWPELPVDTFEGDKPRAMRPAELFRRYGSDCDAVYYCYSRRTEFRARTHRTGDLFVRVLHAEPPTAVRHGDVLEFLTVLLGDRLEVVLDWLATCARLDRPTGVPVLKGDNSLGKSMIPLGLSRFFGESVTDYDDVFKERFNDALTRGPVVWLDETSHVDAKSGRFRKLVGNDRHAIEGKNTPSGTLLGCPRLIVTTNDEDPLGLGREELTRSGEDAIGARIILVDCDPAAKVWLEKYGGREATADWVARADGSPGKIPEFIAWLVKERGPGVKVGSRFLVGGDAAEWASRIGTRQGTPATILDAYSAYMALGATEREKLPAHPFLFDDAYPDHVIVGNKALRDCWQALLGERAQSHRKVAEALTKLAPGGNQKLTLASGERIPGYLVPRRLLPKEADDA